MPPRNPPRARSWLVPEVIQTSAMDCGPAVLACLLRGHGVPADYSRLREVCQTDVDGTSIDTLEAVACQAGLHAEQVMLPADHLLLPESEALPAIVVTVLPSGLTHFVLAWRLHGPFVQVMDPGPDNIEAATIYHNLGGLEHSRGDFAAGEPWGRRSVEVRGKILGDDHPAVAADMAALAALLDGQQKWDEAAELYRHALAVFERVYDPDHYEAAANLNNLGAVARERGDLVTAEEHFRRSLAIKERLLGMGNPDSALTAMNLASVL